MKLRCRACNRPMLTAAYLHASGWALGPVCAAKIGKAKPPKRRSAKPVPVSQAQDGQLGFDFEEQSKMIAEFTSLNMVLAHAT